jgi:hypothetical protein
LDGEAMFLKPEGFDQLHQRGGDSIACVIGRKNGCRVALEMVNQPILINKGCLTQKEEILGCGSSPGFCF